MFVAWFLMASFVLQTFYDFLSYDAKDDEQAEGMSKGQEIFSLCMATVTTVLLVFPAYAMNLAWAYGYM